MEKLYHQNLCFALFLLVVLFFPGVVFADHNHENPWGHTVYFENDLFNGTDSNYTNGVKYSLLSPDLSPHAKQGHLPRQVMEWVHKIPFVRDSSPDYGHKAEFSLGQNMYTPADTSRTDLITNDRPYAGWSYLGLAYHRMTHYEDHLDFLDSVEIQMGMVGPLSFADESQTLVHELRDIDTAKGWHHQLKNEPGLVVAFERKWLFSPEEPKTLSPNLVIHGGGAIGNVATYLNSGLELRYGLNMSRTFGVSLIRPAGSTLFVPNNEPSLYLFGSVNGKLVLRDIFLDGNTFTDSHSVDKESLVADYATGVTFSYGNLMLTYTHVTRTKEFAGQDGSHDFGSLTLNFFYPFW